MNAYVRYEHSETVCRVRESELCADHLVVRAHQEALSAQPEWLQQLP